MLVLDKQFQETLQRLGLTTEVDQYLAEIVWQRCEAAHANKSSQTAALFKTKTVKQKIKKEKPVLTQNELQFLTDLIKNSQSHDSGFYSTLNFRIQECWLLCDPDDASTSQNFKDLNRMKEFKRRYKEHHNKLCNIQRKLKKMR